MRNKRVEWSIFEKLWFIIAMGIVFTVIIMRNKNIVEQVINVCYTKEMLWGNIKDIASVCGVVYGILIAKQDKVAYFFGVINVLLYGAALYNEHVYAGAAYAIIYSFPMMIYGFTYWSRSENSKDLGIQTLSKKEKTVGTIVFAILVIVLSMVLKTINGRLVVLDSTSTIIGYIGMYLTAKKYIEQWNVWIIGNVVGLVMWTFLTFEDSSNASLMAMWGIYLINSIYGYFNWGRTYKKGRR